MGVDLSSLNEKLKADPEMVGGEGYVESSEFIRPLEEGTYTFIQGKVLDADFSVTGKGALQVALNHVVDGGEFDGNKMTFDRVNMAMFDRSGVKASSFLDHLRAIGDKRAFNTGDSESLANAIVAGEGKRFKGIVKWEWYCRDCSETIYKGAGKNPAPKLPNGRANHVAKCPKCGGEIGAQGRIDRRLPLSAEQQQAAAAPAASGEAVSY